MNLVSLSNNHGLIKLAVDYNEGLTVAVANLNPYGQNFVLLKETGCLQIWNLRNNQIITKFDLNENVNFLFDHFYLISY